VLHAAIDDKERDAMRAVTPHGPGGVRAGETSGAPDAVAATGQAG
jgi:hypothetical protein